MGGWSIPGWVSGVWPVGVGSAGRAVPASVGKAGCSRRRTLRRHRRTRHRCAHRPPDAASGAVTSGRDSGDTTDRPFADNEITISRPTGTTVRTSHQSQLHPSSSGVTPENYRPDYGVSTGFRSVSAGGRSRRSVPSNPVTYRAQWSPSGAIRTELGPSHPAGSPVSIVHMVAVSGSTR